MPNLWWLILLILGVIVAVIAVVYLVVPIFQGIAWLLINSARGIAWLVRHVFRFVVGMLSDAVRALGGVLTSLVMVPLVILNIIIGRWSAAGHYGRAFQDEVRTIGHCLYRVVIGHPARLLLLGGLVEGIEQRIPQAVAHAPGADKPSSRTGQFEGYRIIGSLPGGGSGGRLYVAEPDERKRAAFARVGRSVEQVVIKAFSLSDGSSLPQIIRESRALESAKNLGLVLDHKLTDARFFYVMEFIPGDSLSVVTKRLHSEAGHEGLATKQLIPALSMIGDLLAELDRYHKGGLWHKDVKPDNIIINAGRAHLVDLGLVTPLASAMTLTTHGTEYFRDPELVRMALRGAKVNEVDGVKFDIYGAGAVLYSVIENSFPAHGGLSQITKRCPEALRWVVRRAMTDLSNRYATAGEMLEDLRVIRSASDPFALKPADLPSVRGGGIYAEPAREAEVVSVAAAASPRVPRVEFSPPQDSGSRPSDSPRRAPRISVADWWTGRYRAGDQPDAGPGNPFDPRRIAEEAAFVARQAAAAAGVGFQEARRELHRRARAAGRGPGRSAAEQLASAHERIERAQSRARQRMASRVHGSPFGPSGRFTTRPNSGVAAAFFIFLAVAVAIPMFLLVVSASKKSRETDRLAAAVAAAGQRLVEVTTDAGRIGVRLGSKTGAGAESAERVRVAVVDGVRVTVDSGEPDKREVAELNRLGRKVSQFFDRFRDSRTPQEVEVPASVPAEQGTPLGSLLVLNLLPGDVAQSEGEQVALLAERFAEAGCTVRGLSGDASETELLAAGRRVVELAQPDDAEGVARVQAWIDDPATGLDAVLWIGQGKERGEVVRRLIVRKGCDGEGLVRALGGD